MRFAIAATLGCLAAITSLPAGARPRDGGIPGGTAYHPTTSEVRAYIQEVAPQVVGPRAWQLSKAIVFAARHFGVDPLLLAAIVRQESSFQADTKACYLVRRQHASVPTCDYGISQLNQVWVDHWGLEADRLVEDDAYALWFGARVLAILQRQYADDEPNWYSRYNSATPSSREVYEQALEPWLAALEPR